MPSIRTWQTFSPRWFELYSGALVMGKDVPQHASTLIIRPKNFKPVHV
ncbi:MULTISPECIES: hypothetical protein [unclassified Coleofasciculus]|nr:MULTISPECIES: hypothetical protein [unclassified Coleofasciculus]MBE9125640.1 hypothetical protein [Coleofasciculus sp. LEGE 07081]MBE9148794.1 hypothetical protein [Coleofasciculus sp. LEGE 07092]